MKQVNPYLNFRRETAEAFRFYGEVFGTEPQIFTFRDFGEHGAGLPEDERDLVMHAYLPLGDGYALMASDVPSSLGLTMAKGNDFHVMIEADSAEEARRLYERLSAGGEVQMPLQETDWAELYANFTDRFGVGWMINFTGSKAAS